MAPPRLKPRSYTVFYVLSCLMLVIAARWWLGNLMTDKHAAPAKLTDGQYYLDEILDSVTFLVTPVQSDGSYGKSFRLRLVGVKKAKDSDSNLPRIATEFIKDTVGASSNERPVIRIQFDRYRIDPNRTALAYVWIGDLILNVELARHGFVLPDNIVGNSASIQRKIRIAAEEAKQNKAGIFAPHQSAD